MSQTTKPVLQQVKAITQQVKTMVEPIKTENFSGVVNTLFEGMEEKKVHYMLLFVSSVFVGLSIIFGRYLFITFLTFIYAVLFFHLQLARKQEYLATWDVAQRKSYYNFLGVLFLFFTLFWVIFGILKSFWL